MYRLQEILDKSTWNNFIVDSNLEFYSFLQSWEWGEFQELEGKKIMRYGIYKYSYEEGNKVLKYGINSNAAIVGVFLVIKNSAKRGKYYFIPHGPLIKGDYFHIFNSVLDELKTLALLNDMWFIRINSALENTKVNKKYFAHLKFKNSPMHEHAEDTNILNLEIPEDELLSNMKKSDRYYINRAIKECVEIRIDNNIDHIYTLIEMHKKHAKRENGKRNYTPFSSHFIKGLYKAFGKNITTISASYEGEVESILMTIRFGKTCVYYIAASETRHPKFSPNYLCQWEAIKKAKRDGCTTYNFWGVSPDKNPNHPIAGVSKFKRKFGGSDYSLLHAQDLILSPFYLITWIIETIRRKRRGYYYKRPEVK